MATAHSRPAFAAGPSDVSLTSAIDLTRLYRAHVSVTDWRGTERTAFVEACSHPAAIKKIAAVVAALEYCKPEKGGRVISLCRH
jgi:hypothetical protein